jgi:hypothetical protein
MDLFKAPPELRIFFTAASAILWIGIWHTGFGTTSWVIYLLGIFLPFAAATGICPGLAVSRLLYGKVSAGKEKPGPA